MTTPTPATPAMSVGEVRRAKLRLLQIKAELAKHPIVPDAVGPQYRVMRLVAEREKIVRRLRGGAN